MAWSIVEVARMSGVTSRTLRHYDEIGLLAPAGVAANGYRYYEQDQLLRLQQILVLRELDLGLSEIAAIVNQQRDPIAALAATTSACCASVTASTWWHAPSPAPSMNSNTRKEHQP